MSLSSALDPTTESHIRRPEEIFETRELQQEDCSVKLDECQAITGGGSLPLTQWAEILSRFDSEEADDLHALIVSLDEADLSELETSVQSISDRATGASTRPLENVVLQLQDLLTVGDDKFLQALRANNLFGLIFGMVNAGLSVFGIVSGVNITPVQSILKFVGSLVRIIASVAFAIPAGPAQLLFAVKKQVIPFAIRFTLGLLGHVGHRLLPDSPCSFELMRCEFNRMILNVVPATVGELFILEGNLLAAP